MLLANHHIGFGAFSSDNYAPGSVRFDSTDRSARGADNDGAANSGKVILSTWLNFKGGDATRQMVYAGAGAIYRLEKDTSNKPILWCFNSAVTERLKIIGTTSLTTASGWKHLLFSADISIGTPALHYYLSDVDDKSGSSSSSSSVTDIDWTRTNHYVSSLDAGSLFMDAEIADFFFAPGQYADFSVEANRRLFISSTGRPVNLATAISTYSPIAVFRHTAGAAVSDFMTNAGSGGNYTLTGTLAEGSNP